MDVRVKSEVTKHREGILARECSLVEQAQKTLPNRRPQFVDIGCGRYGLLAESNGRMANLIPGSIGIDLDVEGLSKNSVLEHRVGASIYSLPLKSDSVDIIACRWVFEHLEFPEQALAEFSRVLRKGGSVYIKTPNLLNYSMLISRATPTSLHNLFLSKAGFNENIPTFYRANTLKKLGSLGEEAGFRVRNLETHSGSYLYYCFNKELYLIMRGISRAFGNVSTSMQQTLMCVLEKA